MLKTIGNPSTQYGNQTIVDGDLVIGTSGKGINFSAAGGDTLTIYDEGSWTPNQGSGLTVVGAFSSSGKYTRVGRLVTVTGQISGATSIALAAGGIICSNLPIPATSTPYSAGVTVNGNQSAGGQTVAAGTAVWGTAIAATTNIYFTMTYFV